jgi:hypothetical protein
MIGKSERNLAFIVLLLYFEIQMFISIFVLVKNGLQDSLYINLKL